MAKPVVGASQLAGPAVEPVPRQRVGGPLDTLALALVTVLAAILRLLHLNDRSLSLDDGVSIALARADSSTFVHWIWRSEFNMALYYLLLRVWVHVGHSELVVRLLSVLLATATVPAIYLVGIRLFGRSAALMAALLLAVHPFHLALSQQVRGYPLAILLVTLSYLCFLRLLENASAGNVALYGVLSAAAVYSHFLAGLVIPAQWFCLIWLRRPIPWKALAQAAAWVILLLLPAGIYLLHVPQSPVGWVPKASLSQAREVLYSLTLTKERCVPYLLLWAIALWCALRGGAPAWNYRLALSWLVTPLAVAAAAGFVQSLWVPRFLAICLPASMLLAAAGMAQVMRWSRLGGAAILLLLMIESASAIRSYERHPQLSVDWRGAIQYLLPRLEPGDRLVVPPYARFTYDYYRDLNSSPVPPVSLASSLDEPVPASGAENIWLLASALYNPDDPASGARAVQDKVEAFVAAHGPMYCAMPPQPAGASVMVWQLRRCDGH